MSDEDRAPPKRDKAGPEPGGRRSGRPDGGRSGKRTQGGRFGTGQQGSKPGSWDSQSRRNGSPRGPVRDGPRNASQDRPRPYKERSAGPSSVRPHPTHEPVISLSGGRRWGYAPQQRSHQDLRVWQGAMQLAKDVHELTKGFPEEERLGMTSQLRRAAVAIATGIADGSARPSKREFLALLANARGALAELETQLLLSRELEYLKDATALLSQTDIIYGMLNALMKEISGDPISASGGPEGT